MGNDELTHNPHLPQRGKRLSALLGSLRSSEVVGVDDLTHNPQLPQRGKRLSALLGSLRSSGVVGVDDLTHNQRPIIARRRKKILSIAGQLAI